MPVKGNAALRYIWISSRAKEQQKDLISLLHEWKLFFNSFSVYEHARVRPFFSQAGAAERLASKPARSLSESVLASSFSFTATYFGLN